MFVDRVVHVKHNNKDVVVWFREQEMTFPTKENDFDLEFDDSPFLRSVRDKRGKV